MTQQRCWLTVMIAGVFLIPGKAQPPQTPKPGPEQAKLQDLEGTWQASVEWMGQKSTGTMTYKMELGGLFLMSHFQGEFLGGKFEGRGMDTYDPIKKKYVNVWADSMSPQILMTEGNFDKNGKKLTMTGDLPAPDGKLQKITSVSERKDKDTMVVTMTGFAGPDAKELPKLVITYKRKK